MLYVTERAKEYLFQKKFSIRLDNRHLGMRLARIFGAKLALVADTPKPGDQIVTHKDSAVLLVDAQLSQSLLAGWTIDCKMADDGRFEVVVSTGQRPAAASG